MIQKEINNLKCLIDNCNFILLHKDNILDIYNDILNYKSFDVYVVTNSSDLNSGKVLSFYDNTVFIFEYRQTKIFSLMSPGDFRVALPNHVPTSSNFDDEWSLVYKLKNDLPASFLNKNLPLQMICKNCNEYYPYATPVINFECWSCRNGF